MKKHVFYAMMILLILILVGCTACDNDSSSGSVDLTTERGLLCSPEGWVAQESTYEYYDDDNDLCVVEALEFIPPEAKTDPIRCEVISQGDTGDIGIVDGTEEEPYVVFSYGLGSYAIRITASNVDAEPDLTLTAIDDDAHIDKMYFSLQGGD